MSQEREFRIDRAPAEERIVFELSAIEPYKGQDRAQLSPWGMQQVRRHMNSAWSLFRDLGKKRRQALVGLLLMTDMARWEEDPHGGNLDKPNLVCVFTDEGIDIRISLTRGVTTYMYYDDQYVD